VDWKLELVAIPVSDVDRAKAFYTEKVGFNADHDHSVGDEIRFVAARAELVERGVEVSDVQVYDWGSFVFFSDPDGNGWAVQQLPAHD
jgi:catechol 2,3-dioxygenase-like lactoylglutathione lyase family enzyme